MKVTIAAVGRSRRSPEQELFATYQTRFDASAKPLGLGPLALCEVEEKKRISGAALKAREADLLRDAVPSGALLVALDEHAKPLTSADFAAFLAKQRDTGTQALCFLIGGAEGLDPGLLEETRYRIAFGAQTWPHMLVRVMLAEQLYRAASILAGHPYHRA